MAESRAEEKEPEPGDAQEAQPEQVPEEHSDQGEEKQGRSTIVFPYGDLDDAMEIAKALHDEWGGSATVDQVGATLHTSMKSSNFRTKLATAKTFTVTKSENQQVELTPLGRQIVDASQADVAKAKAFLAVPLYKAIFEEYKGDRLPPTKGLESHMISLGVIAKQVVRARQLFQRSAKQAGFFKQGEDRLVLPINQTLLEGGAGTGLSPRRTRNRPTTGHTTAGGTLHPDIERLMATFLRDGQDWPSQKQQAWLQAVRDLDRLTEETDEAKPDAS